jgi:hypothetical protein
MEQAAVPLVLDIMRHPRVEDEARWLASSSLKEETWGLDNLNARNFTGAGLKALLAKALQVPVEHQALQLGSWRPFAETERLLSSIPDSSDERDHCHADVLFDEDSESLYCNNGRGVEVKDNEWLDSHFVFEKLVIRVGVRLPFALDKFPLYTRGWTSKVWKGYILKWCSEGENISRSLTGRLHAACFRSI